VLAGISGMGAVYLQELLDGPAAASSRIVGGVDPEPGRCPRLQDLHSLGVPIFPTLEEFYASRGADLAIVSSPHQFHAHQTCLALAKGSHALCEKPAAGTIQEVRRMIAAERESGRHAAVGYQWSFSPAITALKNDILQGRFGRPRRLKCLYLWPRDEAYYRRNDWAGKKRDAAGAWILDSPAQNSMGHDLHNMFYVLGEATSLSAMPVEVEAELYRTYDIENYDTAMMRARTGGGVEILLYATHVPREEKGPVLCCEFEKGIVRCESRTSGIWAELADGTRQDYGIPDAEPMAKLREMIRCVRTGEPPRCGVEAASAQTLCINGMQDSMPEIRDFPAGLKHVLEDESSPRRLWVEGLDDVLKTCYAANRLPSEMGIAWSARGRRIKLGTQYSFPKLGD